MDGVEMTESGNLHLHKAAVDMHLVQWEFQDMFGDILWGYSLNFRPYIWNRYLQ